MKRSNFMMGVLAVAVGFALFEVKYKVEDIEKNLAANVKQISSEHENIHMLEAEWAYLNEPKRLQQLAHKYLDIIPVKAQQVSTMDVAFETLPHRFPGPRPSVVLASVKGN